MKKLRSLLGRRRRLPRYRILYGSFCLLLVLFSCVVLSASLCLFTGVGSSDILLNKLLLMSGALLLTVLFWINYLRSAERKTY